MTQAHPQIKMLALLRQRIQAAMTDTPQTAHDLWDNPLIRESARDRNHVSITLSDMRKAKVIDRIAVTIPGTNIKFGYIKNQVNLSNVTLGDLMKPAKEIPTPKKTYQLTPEAKAILQPKNKPEITVSDSQVVIDMPTIRIVIELKGL